MAGNALRLHVCSMQQTTNKNHRLPDLLREKLLLLVQRKGLRAAADEIGVSPQTLASAAAGIRANASTVALVERRLAELASEEAKP